MALGRNGQRPDSEALEWKETKTARNRTILCMVVIDHEYRRTG